MTTAMQSPRRHPAGMIGNNILRSILHYASYLKHEKVARLDENILSLKHLVVLRVRHGAIINAILAHAVLVDAVGGNESRPSCGVITSS